MVIELTELESEEFKPKLPLKTKLKRFLRLDSPPHEWELQVFYTTGSRKAGYGWHTLWRTDDHEPKRVEVADKFEPGCRYRVLRRNLETGRYDKICWTHYEPAGPEVVEGARERIEEKIESAQRPLKPRDVMAGWAEELKESLAPLLMLGEIRKDLLGALGVSEGGTMAEIPPLQFSGSAPWFMHPYVVKYGADAMKEVIGYAFDRVEKITKKVGLVEEEEGEEVEEIALPRPSEFKIQEVTPAMEEKTKLVKSAKVKREEEEVE